MASRKLAVGSDYYVGDSVHPDDHRTSLLNHVYQGLDASKVPQGMDVYAVPDKKPQHRDDVVDMRENKCYFSKQDLPTIANNSTEDYVSFKEDLGSSYVGLPPRVSDRSGVVCDPMIRQSSKHKQSKQCAQACLILLVVLVVAAVVVGVIGCITSLYVSYHQVREDVDQINSNKADFSSSTSDLSAFRFLNDLNSSMSRLELSLENHIKLSDSNSTLLVDSVYSLNATMHKLGGDLQSLLVGLTGQVSSMPAVSCPDILQATPSAPSGHYWIRATNGTVVQVYCDMTRVCGGVGGGWKRIVSIDMRDPSTRCPAGLCLNTDNPRTCRKCTAPGGCTRTEFPVPVAYSKVCGKMIGYQVGSTDGFFPIGRTDADGIDLSRGQEPTHIWTFVAGRTENTYHVPACPCLHNRSMGAPSPSYIGNDYFCDTADQTFDTSLIFHSGDPLWDSRGCNVDSTCCSFNNPPWFYKDLGQNATDPVIMKICLNQANNDEDIGLEQVELYVQ